MHDVAVIGGGRVGSRVAYQLAGLGYGVVVLEQKARMGDGVCCTGIISQECVKSFTISNQLILRSANSAVLFSPTGKTLRLWREEVQASILDQAGLDIALAQQAQGSGAEYRLNSPVIGLEVLSDRVSIKTFHKGERAGFEARAAVIATGFNCKLVEKSGFGKINHFVVGAQADVATPDLDEIEIYLGNEVAPGFFSWLVPTTPRKARVGLLSRHSPGRYLKKLMTCLQAQGKIVSADAKLCYCGVPLKPLARTHQHRLLVVGTAAGQVKPTTGGGIYYGLLCADIAAEVLHQALMADDLSSRRLARYDREWRKRLGAELKRGYRVRKLYDHLSDPQIDRLFSMIKTDDLDSLFLNDTGVAFDWHSGGLLKILGDVAVSRITRAIRTPFRAWRG